MMDPDSTPQDRDEKGFEVSENDNLDIPEGSKIIKQVQYAWLWSSMIWVVLLGVIFFTEFMIAAEPLIGAIATVIILLPRYLMWRNTAYILTDDALIYQRGGLTGFRRYTIPISKLRDAQSKFGFFGRTMGFQKVEILFDTGTVASLVYVPATIDLAGRLLELIECVTPEDQETTIIDDAPPLDDDKATPSGT